MTRLWARLDASPMIVWNSNVYRDLASFRQLHVTHLALGALKKVHGQTEGQSAIMLYVIVVQHVMTYLV